MRTFITPSFTGLLAVGLGLGFVSPASADDSTQFAARLAKLRREVEELSEQVENKKDELRGKLRSLAAQQSELEVERQREEMRLRQLREAKAKRIEQVDDDSKRDELFEPVVIRSADMLTAKIRTGLPFQPTERVADIEKIKKQRQDGLLKSADALTRLWDRVEDELRLSKENGLYRQVIEIDGAGMLVDVARIGMVMLFFKTKDGRVGHAYKKGDKWNYAFLVDREQQEQAIQLFDSFKKQIRAGFFLLPNGLVGPGGE